MINIYFFLLLKPLHAIAESCQINWRIERTKTCGSILFYFIYLFIFLQILDITKIKLILGNSVTTELNVLKDINFTFKIFRM